MMLTPPRARRRRFETAALVLFVAGVLLVSVAWLFLLAALIMVIGN